MHYSIGGEDPSGGALAFTSVAPSQHIPMTSQDPMVSLQAQLLMNSPSYTHPAMVASTVGLEPFATVSSPLVASPRFNSSLFDAHRVPSPATTAFSHTPVTTYSPLFTDAEATPSPGCVPSPHTPRSAVKSMLADQKNKQATAAPVSEVQLDQLLDIKPLLRKPIDTSKMTFDQIDRLKRRRERNKAAATRCRIKRREKSHNIREDLAHFTSANDELEREMQQLLEEKQKLETILSIHAQMQHCRISNEIEQEASYASPASHSDSSDDSNVYLPANTMTLKEYTSQTGSYRDRKPPRLSLMTS